MLVRTRPDTELEEVLRELWTSRKERPVESITQRPLLTQITPTLFLGDEEASLKTRLLQELGITRICTILHPQEMNYTIFTNKGQFARLHLQEFDVPHTNLFQYFKQTYHFIERYPGKTLVHCHASVSRSPTIVLAYLMKRFSLTLSQAYHYVQSSHGSIQPNMGFMRQLMCYEWRTRLKRPVRKLLREHLQNNEDPVRITLDYCNKLS